MNSLQKIIETYAPNAATKGDVIAALQADGWHLISQEHVGKGTSAYRLCPKGLKNGQANILESYVRTVPDPDKASLTHLVTAANLVGYSCIGPIKTQDDKDLNTASRVYYALGYSGWPPLCGSSQCVTDDKTIHRLCQDSLKKGQAIILETLTPVT